MQRTAMCTRIAIGLAAALWTAGTLGGGQEQQGAMQAAKRFVGELGAGHYALAYDLLSAQNKALFSAEEFTARIRLGGISPQTVTLRQEGAANDREVHLVMARGGKHQYLRLIREGTQWKVDLGEEFIYWVERSRLEEVSACVWRYFWAMKANDLTAGMETLAKAFIARLQPPSRVGLYRFWAAQSAANGAVTGGGLAWFHARIKTPKLAEMPVRIRYAKAPDKPISYLVTLVREGGVWKVSAIEQTETYRLPPDPDRYRPKRPVTNRPAKQ